jgi:hypothetical protein
MKNMNLKSSLGQLARGVLFACLVALSTNALSIVEDEDPFEPYLESIPTILDTISLENTIHSSVSIIGNGIVLPMKKQKLMFNI